MVDELLCIEKVCEILSRQSTNSLRYMEDVFSCQIINSTLRQIKFAISLT